MPDNETFRIGNYEYSKSLGGYYRWKVGDYTPDGGKYQRSIQKRAYFRNYNKFHGVVPERQRRSLKLSDNWKKQLWSRSEWGKNPWNNKGNRLMPHLRPLSAADNSKTFYGRVGGENGRTNIKWGAKRNNVSGEKNVMVLKGINEWVKHLQLAKHLMSIQPEYFKIVVAQRALLVFQLAFKYHRFYNENTDWQSLAEYTRKKRKVLGTWYGEHRSKLYETGALSSSLSNVVNKKLVSRVTTKNVKVTRTRISSTDVLRGVRVKGRDTYTTDYVYAGIHNENTPKGRKRGGKIPRRQFMGWRDGRSGMMDKVDTFAYNVADRYLFDSVFLARK